MNSPPLSGSQRTNVGARSLASAMAQAAPARSISQEVPRTACAGERLRVEAATAPRIAADVAVGAPEVKCTATVFLAAVSDALETNVACPEFVPVLLDAASKHLEHLKYCWGHGLPRAARVVEVRGKFVALLKEEAIPVMLRTLNVDQLGVLAFAFEKLEAPEQGTELMGEAARLLKKAGTCAARLQAAGAAREGYSHLSCDELHDIYDTLVRALPGHACLANLNAEMQARHCK